MSKMSELHASMNDSYSMGVQAERDRVLAIINVGLQVADILSAIDALKMVKRMVSEGVELDAPKKTPEERDAQAERAFNEMFGEAVTRLESLTIRKEEKK